MDDDTIPLHVPEKPDDAKRDIPCWIPGCPDPWGGYGEFPKRYRLEKRFKRPGWCCEPCYRALKFRQERDRKGGAPTRRPLREI